MTLNSKQEWYCKALASMLPLPRVVLLLHRKDGLDFHQIAYRNGADTQSVATHLADALKHLVREIGGVGVSQN